MLQIEGEMGKVGKFLWNSIQIEKKNSLYVYIYMHVYVLYNKIRMVVVVV